MKKFRYRISQLALLIGVLIVAMACMKDDDDQFALRRMFRPTAVEVSGEETEVEIVWNPSVFASAGSVSYVVEVSKDSAGFDPVIYSDTTQEAAIIITDQNLPIKLTLYARVKALGANSTEDSKWETSKSFKITGEQFLLPIPASDIIDNSAIVHWKTAPDLTKITLTPAGGGMPIEVTLSPTESQTGLKKVENLISGTSYTVEIFKGNVSKGTISFTTKSSISGSSVIHLEGITGKPTILVDTLPDIPSGSVVILKRNEIYTVSAPFLLNKSVTITSALDFSTSKAIIRFTSNFNVTASSAIDSIVFKDVMLRGARASNGSYDFDYILNINNACTVSKIRLEDCIIKILRGTVRLQAGGAGAKVTDYMVNNCVIDSIREYGIATASSASAFANIKITNTTMFKARRFIDHRVAGTNSITIENCTLNELPAGGPTGTPVNYFIDYNTFSVAQPIVIKNCIVGKTWNEGGAGDDVFGKRAGGSTSFNLINSYSTSDFVSTIAANQLGLTTYNGTSTALFTDPANGNFVIKDSGFAGKDSAGDPRWRKN